MVQVSYDVPHDAGPVPSLQQTESWMISLKNTSNYSGAFMPKLIQQSNKFTL